VIHHIKGAYLFAWPFERRREANQGIRATGNLWRQMPHISIQGHIRCWQQGHQVTPCRMPHGHQHVRLQAKVMGVLAQHAYGATEVRLTGRKLGFLQEAILRGRDGPAQGEKKVTPLTVKEMFVVATLPAAAMTKDDTRKAAGLRRWQQQIQTQRHRDAPNLRLGKLKIREGDPIHIGFAFC